MSLLGTSDEGQGQKAKADLLWGFIAQSLQYGAGLLLLPVLVTRLTSEEVGFWFVLLAVQSLVGLLDFGFSPTFARNFTFVFSGARELRREGVSEKSGQINIKLLASLVGSAKAVYLLLALAAMLLLLVGGTSYVHLLIEKSPSLRNPMATWVVFCLTAVLNIALSWQNALLLGGHRVRGNYQIGIVNRVSMLIASWIGLLLFHQLFVVAVAYAIGVVLSRALGWYLCRDLLPALPKVKNKLDWEVIQAIWYSSSRMGLVTFGAFLINRYSVFVVSYFYGLSQSASYSIALQMLSVAAGMAQVAFVTYLPRLAACRISEDHDLLKNYFIRSNLYAWAIFFCIAFGIIFLSDWLLLVIHSKTTMPARPLLILMAVVAFLECNHSNAALVITTENKVPFVAAALYSGLAIFVLASLAGWEQLGVWSVVAAQGLVQVAYNNWQWPLRVHRELKIHWRDYRHALYRAGPQN